MNVSATAAVVGFQERAGDLFSMIIKDAHYAMPKVCNPQAHFAATFCTYSGVHFHVIAAVH